MEHEPLGQFYAEHHAKRGKYGFSVAAAERGAIFSRWIGQGHDVLDLGCRDGTLTRCYLEGNRVTGVDVDAEALQRASRELGALGDFQAASFDINQPFPYPAASFDRVVLGEVLEHTIFPERVAREIHHCLRPGGCFLGSVPNAFRLRNRLLFLCGREFETDPSHLHRFHPDALRRLLAEAGFERIELLPIGGRHHRLHPYLLARRLLWRCWK